MTTCPRPLVVLPSSLSPVLLFACLAVDPTVLARLIVCDRLSSHRSVPSLFRVDPRMAAPAPISQADARLSGEGGSRRASVQGSVMSAQGAQTHGEDLWSLTVRLVCATDLMTADLFTRSSDPYAKFLVDDAAESKRKSKVVKKSLSPEWNETFTWVTTHKPAVLSVEIKDWEAVGHHDSLGSARIPLDAITGGQPFEGELTLEGKGIKHGRVTLRVDAMPIPNIVGRSTDELRGVKNVEDIVSLIDLKVCGAENLGGSANHGAFKRHYDPFCTVTFGLHHFKTATVPRNNNPEWQQLCPLWMTLSDNNSQSILKVSVFDFEHLTSARLLGHAYIKPANMKVNHFYDVLLPLTMEGATTDAQLTVLMRDLDIDRQSTLPHADVKAAAVASGATSGALPEHSGTSTPASTAAAAHTGQIHLQFTIKPREQVENEFYRHLISDYDADGSNTMDLVEITHMLTALGIKKLTEADILESFALADVNKTNALGVPELAVLFRTPNFERQGVLRQLYAVITYGAGALDSLLMKGCLTGSNVNLEPDADPTVDNEGTRIMVQDRESGLVVRENIPAYIKSALVLLNRTWMGKMASGRIKGTLRTLTKKQGAKMDLPASAKDIPNFVKIHRQRDNHAHRRHTSTPQGHQRTPQGQERAPQTSRCHRARLLSNLPIVSCVVCHRIRCVVSQS